MHRTLISTVLAASLAVTSLTTTSAQAGDRDTAGALAAIAGIAVLGAIINDRNDRKRTQAQTVTRAQPYKRNDVFTHVEPRRIDRHVQPRRIDRHVQPRRIDRHSQPRRANRKLLPGQCLRSLHTRQGKVRMFGARCLHNSFTHANRLPSECGIRVRTNQGPRRGYEARCLRNHGYQLARR